MMKYLSKKFNDLTKSLSLSLEEISAGTKKHGDQIGFASLKNLKHGTGGTNPSGSRIFALAKTIKVPVRYLLDDGSEEPYQAVLADAYLLSDEEREKLLTYLAS